MKELAENGFKAFIIKIFQQAIRNMLEKNGENVSVKKKKV